MFTGIPLAEAYYLPITSVVDKTNVNANYFTIPVMYRFHILDQFYIGAGLDIAMPFLATANYSMLSYKSEMDYTKRLQPVDLGVRLVFGFTMNRVFIELGLGCGVLYYDRLPGERHSIYLTGMIGYRI